MSGEPSVVGVTHPIRLSVAMSVYNGAASLAATLESILGQTERDFELIVVNDGSTDDSGAILDAYAAGDRRIRVITQENTGLTRALIRACAEARADVIARHDAGDLSHPERFARQLEVLRDDVVVASCFMRWVGPEGEVLSETKLDGDSIRRSLLHGSADTIESIPHPTAMFRRDAYFAAGGYRPQFRYAQDIDLWIRIARLGRISVVPQFLYDLRYQVGSISASRRAEQVELTKVAIAIRDGGGQEMLERALAISEKPRPPLSRRDTARALYFIASCLRRNGDMRYKRYVREALRHDPLHARAWLLLIR